MNGVIMSDRTLTPKYYEVQAVYGKAAQLAGDSFVPVNMTKVDDKVQGHITHQPSPISHHPSAITHLTSLISPQCFRAPTDNDKSFGNWLAKDWKRCGLDTLRIPMTTAIDGNQLTFTFEIPDTLPPLPRLGIVIRLPREYEQLTWQGRGPWDNYPDRKTSCPVGLWQSTVSQQYVHYPRPQDSGNHEDCTLVELKTNDGRRLRIEAVGDAFSFSALPYSAQYLASKTHDYQLQDQGYTYLSIDCAVMGLGNSSCGPGVLKKYTIDPKQKHQLKIRITE
jgi:beta-galactosidase